MSLPLKVAATAGVVGGGSLVGCYFGGVFSGTPCVSLSEEEEVKSVGKWSEYNDKIGKSYGIYLAAVYGKDNANERWWKKAFEKYQEDKRKGLTGDDELTSHFSSVGFAYSPSGATSGTEQSFLNKVCESAYKKASSEVDFGTGAANKENKHKLGRDVLKYCSPLGEVPKKLSSRTNFNTEYTSGIGKDKKDELADFEGNDAFWDIKQKQFDGDKETLKTNNFFKEYIERGDSIAQICKSAYEKTSSDPAEKGKPKADEIVKYCSFKTLP